MIMLCIFPTNCQCTEDRTCLQLPNQQHRHFLILPPYLVIGCNVSVLCVLCVLCGAGKTGHRAQVIPSLQSPCILVYHTGSGSVQPGFIHHPADSQTDFIRNSSGFCHYLPNTHQLAGRRIKPYALVGRLVYS